MKKKQIIFSIIILFFIFIGIILNSLYKIPENETYILNLMVETYPQYSVKGYPDPLDPAIEVTYKNGKQLTKEEIGIVRDFFNNNYSGSYWAGIPHPKRRIF